MDFGEVVTTSSRAFCDDYEEWETSRVPAEQYIYILTCIYFKLDLTGMHIFKGFHLTFPTQRSPIAKRLQTSRHFSYWREPVWPLFTKKLF